MIPAQTSASEFGDTTTVPVNGTRLAYREQGSGEPVVFVHGGLSDLRTWERQLDGLGGACRAIAYSRRYARPNEDIRPGADDQLLPHVDDLAAVLRGLDAAPAHLIGNSWGAFTCLLLAVRRPHLVRTLVLEEPPVIPLVIGAPAPQPRVVVRNLVRRPATTMSVLRFGARTVAPVQRAFRRGDDEAAMLTFVHGVLGRDAYERLPPARRRQMRENLSALRAQMLGRGFPPLGDGEVAGVHAPTLLLTGEHSPGALVRLTERLEQLLPSVEREEIPGASHAMHEENAGAVSRAILAFLGRHRDGGGS